MTAQQVGIAFPRDVALRESYLQALTALPASFAVFLVGVVALGFWLRQMPDPGRLAGGVLLLLWGWELRWSFPAIWLQWSECFSVRWSVQFWRVGFGMLLDPVVGAILAGWVLGRNSLRVALPAALLPAAFLCPSHTGLWVLGIARFTVISLAFLEHSHRNNARQGFATSGEGGRI